jgi:hypothetical protein
LTWRAGHSKQGLHPIGGEATVVRTAHFDSGHGTGVVAVREPGARVGC